MSPINVHLICNAHLDPVWQWRWDEGASEALATFRNAVDILDEHPSLVFCHNEAVLYQWAERLDPALFDDIRRLVRAGRWAISGGWFLQPDVNLPGTESLVRTIAEGRRYFRDRFGAAPRVAYNFDSFGHSGGLPQILRLGRLRDVHPHAAPGRRAGAARRPLPLARRRRHDDPGLPDRRRPLPHRARQHRGAAARRASRWPSSSAATCPSSGASATTAAERPAATSRRSTPSSPARRASGSSTARPTGSTRRSEEAAAAAPVHDGDLQRVFTGCYTSLSRLKRRAVESLGGSSGPKPPRPPPGGGPAPASRKRSCGEAWKLHLFNDFHDILTGSCIEPAERDALAQYGRAEDTARTSRSGPSPP